MPEWDGIQAFCEGFRLFTLDIHLLKAVTYVPVEGFSRYIFQIPNLVPSFQPDWRKSQKAAIIRMWINARATVPSNRSKVWERFGWWMANDRGRMMAVCIKFVRDDIILRLWMVSSFSVFFLLCWHFNGLLCILCALCKLLEKFTTTKTFFQRRTDRLDRIFLCRYFWGGVPLCDYLQKLFLIF